MVVAAAQFSMPESGSHIALLSMFLAFKRRILKE
jgi:hypothetical protein